MGKGRHVPPAGGNGSAASGASTRKAPSAGRRPSSAHAVDTQKARAWLRTHGVTSCPACKGEELHIGKDFFRAEAETDGGLPAFSRMVRVRCGKCSHLMFFHARHMGLG